MKIMYSLAHCYLIFMTATTIMFYWFLEYQFIGFCKYGLRINVGSFLREYMEKLFLSSYTLKNHRNFWKPCKNYNRTWTHILSVWKRRKSNIDKLDSLGKWLSICLQTVMLWVWALFLSKTSIWNNKYALLCKQVA